jgi:hypothetical protein
MPVKLVSVTRPARASAERDVPAKSHFDKFPGTGQAGKQVTENPVSREVQFFGPGWGDDGGLTDGAMLLPNDGLRIWIAALLLARHRRLLLEGRDEPRGSLTNLLPLRIHYN